MAEYLYVEVVDEVRLFVKKHKLTRHSRIRIDRVHSLTDNKSTYTVVHGHDVLGTATTLKAAETLRDLLLAAARTVRATPEGCSEERWAALNERPTREGSDNLAE